MSRPRRRSPRATLSGPPVWRRRALLGAWLLGGVVVVGKAVSVQVVEGSEWRARAEGQHRVTEAIPAARGTIVDRDGEPLAVSQETWEVAVATDQLADRAAAGEALRDVLGISAATARRVTAGEREWHVVPGRYETDQREALDGVPGLHFTRVLDRIHLRGEVTRTVLGRVRDGTGAGGIEERYDSVLRGVPGERVLSRDGRRRPIPGESWVVEEPVDGGTVRLTLDLDLQEIAWEALTEAVEASGARGGDVLVVDPATGELLALASVGRDGADARTAINAPYEPGSTLKPFTVAGLLEAGGATLADSVDTEGGVWRVGGHPLRDIGNHGVITLAEALRVSSNIGVAKAARGLTPARQYENLRDFGFGTLTGIPLPGEVPGTLRRPEEWSARSPASLAIGYEIGVTPLQMTMAYAALANGGSLMEPRLVREVRDRRGRMVEVPEPREVRRAVSPEVTRHLTGALVDVVEAGTGTAARMSAFRMAGKSGTSRSYVPGKGYASNDYFASFVGYFPADDPQLVVFVKITGSPTYGGATAAPVIRGVVEGILASRDIELDRNAILRASRRVVLPPVASPEVRFAGESRADPRPGTFEGRPAAEPGVAAGPDQPVPVPDVTGLPARTAARRLHARGFRVSLEGSGPVVASEPRAGVRRPPGDTIRLHSAPPGTGRRDR